MQLASTAQGFSYLQKELELKQNLVGEGFARPPNEGSAKNNFPSEITDFFNRSKNKCDRYLTYELEKPQNWLFDNDDEDYSNEPPELLEELTRTSSTTNIAKPSIVYEEGEAFPVFHYSFPLDWQFSVDEAYLTQKWPTIVVQVNSLDSWGRYRVEGYGFVELPRYCGVHHLEVRTWKPHANQDNQAFSFFLGGSIGVKEPKCIAKTSHKLDYDEEAIVNRYNISTESAGTVHLTLNVLKQTEGVMQKARKDFRDVKYQEKLGELKLQNDEAYTTGTFNRTEGNAPALMRTENFGLISRFSHH